jgi:hypothetical protein
MDSMKTFEAKDKVSTANTEEKSPELRTEILTILEGRKQFVEYKDFVQKLKMEQKKSVLSYHLKQLVNQKLIKKKEGTAIYYISPIDKLAKKILKILELDNCGQKSIHQIQELLKSDGDKKSEEEITESLNSLKLSLSIFIRNEILFYEISPNRLGERGYCTFCRGKFKKDQLVVAQMIYNEDYELNENLLIHATCRPELYTEEWNPFDSHENTNCSYCGLNLNAHLLRLQIRKDNEINVDADIAKIFDDPFSKIFSVIDQTKYRNLGGPLDESVLGFAHFKRKDGRQYHPYCFNIIEKQNEEEKK